MVNIIIKEQQLQQAAAENNGAFVNIFVDAIYKEIGGELTADTMSELNSQQITLLAYCILRDEVMNGGFVQLIHNGYGDFIFRNPLDKALRNWGLNDLYKVINSAHSLYKKYHEQIEEDCSDDEFMAMYEQFPEFDTYDDDFVAHEEYWTNIIAHYIDEHINDFAKIEK